MGGSQRPSTGGALSQAGEDQGDPASEASRLGGEGNKANQLEFDDETAGMELDGRVKNNGNLGIFY